MAAILAKGGAKPDFSGTWELNLAKSKLEIAPPDTSTFYIDHKEPSFRLRRTHVYGGKPNTWAIELTTGGPEVTQKEENFHTRLFWKHDALVFDSYWLADGVKTTNVVTYTLRKAGKVFIADEKVAGPRAKHHTYGSLTGGSLTVAIPR